MSSQRRSSPSLPLSQLKSLVPTGQLLTAPAQLTAYEADGLGYKRFKPDAVVIPGNARELHAVVQLLRKHRIPFTPRGAGTSLSGGPVAAQGGVILHLSRLRNIVEINTTDAYAVVETGVVLNHLDAALKPLGLYYPPDPSTGPVCTLGGNVASNSGGVHCFRYGVTSNYVLGVEALLLDGSTVRFGGPAGGLGEWQKDWKRLFVGSEGTLGIFTKFWLRLIPRPDKVWTFRATYPTLEQASDAIRRLATHPAFPVAIEFMDPRCVDMVENSPMRVGLPKGSFMILTEIDGPAPLVDSRVESVAECLRLAGASDVLYSSEEKTRYALWKARKVQSGLLGQMSPDFIVQDAVIPKARLAEMLHQIYALADAEGIATMTVMHAGDGNLHPNFLFDSRSHEQIEKVERISKKLMQKVSDFGGTLSGEHGIGNDKSAYITHHLGVLGQRIQLTIPRLFNPAHQLNPLKVFPDRHFTP